MDAAHDGRRLAARRVDGAVGDRVVADVAHIDRARRRDRDRALAHVGGGGTGSANAVAHSTVMSSAPFAMIRVAVRDRMLADAVLLGAGFGSAVADVTFADAAIAEPLPAAQSASVTIRVNVAEAPTASDGLVHCTGPLAPAPARRRTSPRAPTATEPVRAGTAVVSDTFAAGRSSSVGLNDAVSTSALFVTVIV